MSACHCIRYKIDVIVIYCKERCIFFNAKHQKKKFVWFVGMKQASY